jgi:molecular chaperone DnaK
VYDFGGGTFDVTVLEVGDDVIEVKSTDGDSHMGGEDIDREIIKWIANEFQKESADDVVASISAATELGEIASVDLSAIEVEKKGKKEEEGEAA